MDVKFIIFVVFGFVYISLGDNTKYIKFGFLLEQLQEEYVRDIVEVLKELEGGGEEFKVEENMIVLNRDDLAESRDQLCATLYNGIAFFIDLTYTPWNDGFELLNYADVPHLKLHPIISPLLDMLGEYLKARLASDVALIMANELYKEEAIYRIVAGFEYRVIILNGEDEQFVQILKDLRPRPSYYAVLGKTEHMDRIFKKLIHSDAYQRPDKWHFIFMDSNSDKFQYRKEAFMTTKITLNMGSSQNYLSISKFFFKEVLRELASHLYDNNNIPMSSFDCKQNTSTSFFKISNFSKIVKTAESLHIENVTDFSNLIENNEFLHMENDVVMLNVSAEIQKYGLDANGNYSIWYRNGVLEGNSQYVRPAKRFFRIGTAEGIPWSYMRRDPNTHETILDSNGNPIWEGYCIDLIEKMAEKLSFDYEIIHPIRGTFGHRYPDGSWDGVVGDLVTGETDLAVSALKMTAEREEVIDFIAPYFDQTGISIVIRKAVRQTSLFKFMTVLRVEVWLSIGAAVIATSVMIWLLDKYSPYSSKNNKTAYPYPCRDFSLKESIWFTLTSFTPQGGGETPKAVSARVLVAAYWLFVTLMLATFTANLAAFLTVERMQTPVQSLEQLARQSRINYTVVEGSDTHKYFINMKFAEDTLYRLWKELALNATSDQSQFRIWDYPIKEQYGHILLAINSSNPVIDANEGFRLVNQHENADFAFIHDSAEIKYEISRNCNLTEVGEVFAEQPYAIAVQQGSHLQDEISYAIIELQKDRYFEGLTAKYWNYSTSKGCSRSEDSEGITLESLGGVFIATLFGLALSMITLAGEVFYYKKKFGNNIISVKEADKSGPNVTPPPSFEAATFRGRTIPDKITIGDTFVPVSKRQTLSVTPRKAINNRNYID